MLDNLIEGMAEEDGDDDLDLVKDSEEAAEVEDLITI